MLENLFPATTLFSLMRHPNRRIANFAAAMLLLGTLLFAGGCSSFNQDWRQAGLQAPLPDTMEGRWQGVWVSEVNHHADQLRCVVTRKEDGTYRARFHAKYRKVLSFGYAVPLKVEPETNGVKFSGEANLGWLAGGVYHYNGHASATNFFSTYSCKYDHGIFQMSRP